MLNKNSFKEVSKQAGIVWSKTKGYEAFSVAWIDFNNDGLQDLWVSGHGYHVPTDDSSKGKYPSLYLNQGDGTFTNKFKNFWTQTHGDTHGTTWADFDNDNDLDLMVSVGAELGDGLGGNLFYVNDNGTLRLQDDARGLEYKFGRGRSSLWFDFDKDGLLDVLLLSGQREDGKGKTAFFRQRNNGTFENISDRVGLNFKDPTRFAQLSDLTGDGKLDLVIHGTYKFPAKVYDISSGSKFRDITNQFPSISDPQKNPTKDFNSHASARDVAIADFNNDLRPDIFFTRSQTKILGSSIFQANKKLISADLLGNGNKQLGFNFKTTGKIAFDTFDVSGNDIGFNASQIFIGASGRNPTKKELKAFLNSVLNPDITSNAGFCPFCGGSHTNHKNSAAFQLDSQDNSVLGIKSDRSKQGIYIGYDSSNQTWQVRYQAPKNNTIRLAIEGSNPIVNYSRVGFQDINISQNGLSDRLWMYDPQKNKYVDRSAAAGVNRSTLGQSVVAGDFDNDMDVDLYIANAYDSFNAPNLLYENQGDGTFVVVEQAGGASGSAVGPHMLDFEVGQRLTVADYDNDGYLDVFAGSLSAKSPRKTYLGEPSQLFQNQGKGNNWIEIDLEGTKSNRDGIGARVIITTPDGTEQLREQGGGSHAFAQNTQRLHFGLAKNKTISKLVVEWSSGIKQEFKNVKANQILKIVENKNIRVQDSNSNEEETNGNNSPTNNNDSLIGGQEADQISGLQGADTIKGNQGDDLIFGGNSNDSLYGGEGNDLLRGDDGDDFLSGESGTDRLEGSAGNDILVGGAGDDTLSGANGADKLVGGPDRDNFVYQSPSHGNDRIVDFQSGIDQIVVFVSGFGAGLNSNGNSLLEAEQFTLGKTSQDKSDRFVYDRDNGKLFFDSNGSDPGNQTLIATFDNKPDLNHEDIFVAV